MILAGGRVATDATSAKRRDFEIQSATNESIDASGLLLLPGLINAHDHLEFNLFPRLGSGIYNNATEWAADIHRPNDSPVKEHVAIPMPIRLIWGGIRNLLSGVTTVAHHNPWEASVFDRDFLVRVLKEFAWAHSLAFSLDLKERFRNTPAGWPFIVHAAEGNDANAGSEIARLDELGVLAPHTVLVHAIGAGKEDLNLIRQRGASIVWCPRSNLSTYGRTLSLDALHSGIRIALGTDSAITSPGDLLDEIRTAVECGVSAESVYRMVTSDAAAVLRRNNVGALDIVAVTDEGQTPAEAILNLRPEFVMLDGRFTLLSERMAAGPLGAFAEGMHPIHIASRDRCFIDADVPRLFHEAAKSLGPVLQLAGRRVNAEAAA